MWPLRGSVRFHHKCGCYTGRMLWVKAFHIVFVASWFAGLFYLPRLFVNLALVPPESVAERERLLVMARKLMRFTTLLAVPALALGLWLWLGYGVGRGPGNGWMHAKLAVVDGRWLSIGSMNMDRRSAQLNTEMVLIADSPVLAAQAASLMRGERLPQAYQLRAQGGGSEQRSLQWVSQQGEAEVVLAREPALNWGRRLRLSVLAAMVDEELL